MQRIGCEEGETAPRGSRLTRLGSSLLGLADWTTWALVECYDDDFYVNSRFGLVKTGHDGTCLAEGQHDRTVSVTCNSSREV